MALILQNWAGTSGQEPPSIARTLQRKNEVVVDALPYLDKEYDDESMKDVVDRCATLPGRNLGRRSVIF